MDYIVYTLCDVVQCLYIIQYYSFQTMEYRQYYILKPYSVILPVISCITIYSRLQYVD